LRNFSTIAAFSYNTLHLFRYSTFRRRGMLANSSEEVTMKNDTQIRQDVIAELEQDETLPADSIGVEVHHGVVKLAGRNGDTDIKQRAVRRARRVDGVTGIILNMGSGIERR
jgi:osmotically-inducible protein OsmY